MGERNMMAPRRVTVRTRLAISYALLVTGCGAALLAIVSVFMGYVPNYAFGAPGNTLDRIDISLEGGGPLPEGMIVEVGTRADMLQLLLTVSGAALLLLAGVSTIVAWWLAGRMLRPLSEVNEAARRAAEGQLDYRIDYTGPRDEIAELADTFDEMLVEIERSVDSHRHFAANASHELRTPLATIRTILDVANSTPGYVDRNLLKQLREINERSIETVEALLDLAEAEAGTTEVEQLDLARVVADAVTRNRDEFAQHEIAATTDLLAVEVGADPVLLRQLVQNLIQNAIHHNTHGGTVSLATQEIAEADGRRFGRLTVINSGAGVSATDVDRLAEPFQRGAGRTAGERRGLGLSIVRAIVSRSQGRLRLTPHASGGLEIQVDLPATSQGRGERHLPKG